MIFLLLNSQLRDPALNGRVVFFAGGTPPSSSAKPDVDAEAAAKKGESLDREQRTALEAKIDGRQASGDINEDVRDLAREALDSDDKSKKKLAQMLAEKKIEGGIFEMAYDCLDDGNRVEKALAKRLMAKEVTPAAFESALAESSSGDTYSKGLARQLAYRGIDGDTYEQALELLDSDDQAVKWAAQRLAKAQMNSTQFKEEVGPAKTSAASSSETGSKKKTPEQKKPENEVAKKRREIHDRIMELLVGVDVMMEQLPEQERTRPILKLQKNLVQINNRDRNNRDGLTAYLRKLNEDTQLKQDDLEMIQGFTITKKENFVDKKEDFENFETALEALPLTPGQIANIMRLKREEWQIEQDFIQQSKTAGEVIKSAVHIIDYETLKHRMLEESSKMCGINLKAGTQIQYTTIDPAHNNIGTRTIKKVEVQDAAIVDGINGDSIGKQPVTLIIYLDNGERYTLGRFMKWVDAADINEVVKDQAELEKNLGLPQVGMRLQAGQTLDYTKNRSRDDEGNIIPTRDTVKIQSIDDEKVILDKAVVTLTPDQEPSARLTAPRIARELSLGEFAKWAHRNDAIPEIKDIKTLQEHLRNHTANLNQEWEREAKDWPPIRAEAGEVLQFGDSDSKQFQIKKAEDDGITFKDGTRMTLPQFLGWVRQNKVERANAQDAANREINAAANVGEVLKEAEKDGILQKFLNSIKSRETPEKEEAHGGGAHGGEHGAHGGNHGHHGKSFFEKMSPFTPPENNYGPLKKLFYQHTFLSMKDLIHLGKELIEFIKRKHERKSKRRFGYVGQMLPSFLGDEFKRIYQGAENEEVQKYQESYKQLGIWELSEKLHTTDTADVAKACFLVLGEKGELRWDDMKMWATLNRLTSSTPGVDGEKLNIELTEELQNDPTSPGHQISGQDKVKYSVDALWGDGTWAEWFAHNHSAFESGKSKFENKAKQLEVNPKGLKEGGLDGELKRLLREWKEGKYVSPHEYEEMIDWSIKAGKLTAEDKLFFIMEGLTAKCPSGPMQGMTLLEMDRIGEIEGKYLNSFPLLDFFTSPFEKPFHPRYLKGEITLEETKKVYNVEDLQAFIDMHFKDESNDNKAGKNFSKFLWEYMIVDPRFRQRLSKGIARSQNMDHDDAHLYMPASTLEQVETFTGAFTGTQKYFTDEGYKNGYPGYNQYIISLSNRQEELQERLLKGGAEELDGNAKKAIEETKNQMLEAVRSYYLFDAVLSGRRDKTKEGKARLGKFTYDEGAVVDRQVKIKEHKEQLDNLVKAVCDAYHIDWKEKGLYEELEYSDIRGQEAQKARMQVFLEKELPDAIERDGIQKMFDIVSERKKRAISDSSDPNALRGITSSNRLIQDKKAA
ncbi:MAG: hypothetical protein WC882_00115 [Candidatus Gracilibacteria bacterium]